MYPPIFSVCSSDSGVQALLGVNPTRLYPFGEAAQGVTLPYAVWQTVGGSPENYINQVPDVDSLSIQVDIYAATPTSARAAAAALRDAIEPIAHITRWGGEVRDPDTNHYRLSFDVDWWINR